MTEKLEFEESNNDRIFRIDKEGSKTKRTQPFLVSSTDGTPRKSFTTNIPNSDLLNRLSDFLPRMRKSNEDLLKIDPEERDIESIPEGSRYIKMKLGLGVFDVKDTSDKPMQTELLLPGSEQEPQKTVVESFLEDSSSSDEAVESNSDTNFNDESFMEEIDNQ